MFNLEWEYQNVKKTREEIFKELDELKQNEAVIRYLELTKKSNDIVKKEEHLYEELKLEEYEKCSHIIVTINISDNRFQGRGFKCHGCIKCGLDNSYRSQDVRMLPIEYRIMHKHLEKNYLTGKDTNIACDLELGKAIYAKIKEHHPNIDDDTAIKYFEIALNNIREVKVSDERVASRVKRLNLNKKFNRWQAYDITNNRFPF